MNITYDNLKSLYAQKDYAFFDTGSYNLNLFGIRSELGEVDEFNDIIGMAFRNDFGDEQVVCFKATTDPGLYWLKNKMGNINGTAILCPGQYRQCWDLGFHKGYQALQQSPVAKFKVWRDNDADGDLDESGTLYADVSGLNCHTTSFKNDVEKVGRYSAGCQVIQDDLDFHQFMSIIKKSANKYGSRFSYTLFRETDFL